ncbi:MAG: aminopeptidase, partial [Alistipes sp.]|nr:aminopeptidase [Alistipes sp.]
MRASSIITTLLLLLAISCSNDTSRYDAGVSRELAEWRKETISELKYNIDIDLVENIGKVDVEFAVERAQEIVIDFRATENILAVERDAEPLKHRIESEHIIIPKSEIEAGNNSVSIDFKVDNQSLNRNEEFLYTLLVPDRARTLFPCFEQPDMKASY